MLIKVIDGRVISIEKSYFPVLLWGAMSGDLAGLIGANGAGKRQ
ncbi:hypothetical protein [Bacillus atrophaeus]|nr:hypothetical protein [Bacillus atrophaeus]